MLMLLYRLEQAIVTLPLRRGRVTLVVVLKEASADNFDFDLLREFVKVFRTHYPDRLHQCLVWPVGLLYRLLWIPLSMFLGSDVSDKVRGWVVDVQ